MSDKKEYKAFVIMPFAPEYNAVYNDLIVPALEEAGYDVKRADDISTQGSILSSIINSIYGSDLIVAELTEPNPNVYYELGIAHTMNKSVVMLTQVINTLPFDIRGYRVIKYSRDFAESSRLVKELKTIATKTRNNEILFRNPVLSSLPTEVNLAVSDTNQLNTENKVIPKIEEYVEKGFLDYLNDSHNAHEAIQIITDKLSHGIDYIAEIQRVATEDLNRLNKHKNYHKDAYAIVSNVANELNKTAIYYEEQITPYRETWDQLRGSQDSLFLGLQIRTDEDVKATEDYRQAVLQLSEGIAVAISGFESYSDTLRQMKLNIPFNRARNRMLKVLEEVLGILSIGTSISSDTAAVLEKMIADYEG